MRRFLISVGAGALAGCITAIPFVVGGIAALLLVPRVGLALGLLTSLFLFLVCMGCLMGWLDEYK